MLSFEELTDARRLLQSFCGFHAASLMRLQSGISFRLLPSEPELTADRAHHLTTSATCFDSLADCPPGLFTADALHVNELRGKFAAKALERTDWVSEGSAGIYCRCRALPAVVTFLNTYNKSIESHLNAIFAQLDSEPSRFGIGEAGAELPSQDWYPPNAFHTYWTLETLDRIKASFRSEYEALLKDNSLDLKRKTQGMLVWARQQLGSQLGLHSSSPASSTLDSDQLAWALTIFLSFDETLKVNLEKRDFIKQALTCLFSTQTDGTWRHYKPLFHYKKIGNAYCYVFETFTALLRCALREGAEAEMIRELLKPYAKNLIDLWRYADSTKIPLSQSSREFGWCSDHRTNVTVPESWATASVFSYAQALRRLIGIWCREEAQNNLRTPRKSLSIDKAEEEIASRGKTWGSNKTSVAERLWTMFVNPARKDKYDDKFEPDNQPIGKHRARSAILFGPPGTSKTTLIRALADAIEWQYVEIHASHFVAEGLTEVQKTADRIFKQLSELDHAVVLFDEIDELVRERDMEKDAFGRFLTTSMLPKLAELWEARKILYFVATNHINYFDSAIIRSHRFDALILVSPTSFSAKIDELKRLLSDTYTLPKMEFDVSEQDVEKELEELDKLANGFHLRNLFRVFPRFTIFPPEWREQKLTGEHALSKFALLRWDELNELAYRLVLILKSKNPYPARISQEILREALMQVDDSEWRKNKSYADYLRDRLSERRDYQMLNVWEVHTDIGAPIVGVEVKNNKKWISSAVNSIKDVELPGYELRPAGLGIVDLRAEIKE
ncbi:MAG: ATP-binding protein [Candidatus Angelobacter sp.]